MNGPSLLNPFTGRDVPQLVDSQATRRPRQTFLVWESFAGARRTWSYAEFAEETRAYAAGLIANGVTANDVVVLHMENCPEFLFIWHACARVGALVVTTNTNSSTDELRYFVEHSRAAVVITQPRLLPAIRAARLSLRWIACTATDLDAPPETDRGGTLSFEALRGDAGLAPARAPEALRLNSVQYTSGTTARPKGVAWTHANALWSGRVSAAHLRLTPEDVAIVYLPLFHVNALGYSHLGTLYSGGTVVLMPRFSSSRFWDIATRNKCTWASHIVFTQKAVATLPDPPAHSFRFFVGGAGNTHAHARWGIASMSWYGMTETVSHVIHSDWQQDEALMSMGRVAQEYQVSIRREGGGEADLGERGRLWVRGQRGISMFAEYLHDPLSTAAAFDEDGFFDTGDEVTAREDGEVFYASRAKDMLKVGAENVAAIEIESVLLAVPGVIEAAVVGKPDPMLDEVPVAFVVAAPGVDLNVVLPAIYALCQDRLSRFKRPREVRFVESLPKGLLDKVLKKSLRDVLLAESAADHPGVGSA